MGHRPRTFPSNGWCCAWTTRPRCPRPWTCWPRAACRGSTSSPPRACRCGRSSARHISWCRRPAGWWPMNRGGCWPYTAWANGTCPRARWIRRGHSGSRHARGARGMRPANAGVVGPHGRYLAHLCAQGPPHLKRTDWFHMRASASEDLVPQVEEDIQEVRWLDADGVARMRSDTYPHCCPCWRLGRRTEPSFVPHPQALLLVAGRLGAVEVLPSPLLGMGAGNAPAPVRSAGGRWAGCGCATVPAGAARRWPAAR